MSEDAGVVGAATEAPVAPAFAAFDAVIEPVVADVAPVVEPVVTEVATQVAAEVPQRVLGPGASGDVNFPSARPVTAELGSVA